MSPQLYAYLLFGIVPYFFLVAGFLAVLFMHGKNRRTVGTVLHQDRPERNLRRGLWFALAVLTIALGFVMGIGTMAWGFALTLLLLALPIVLLSPGSEDALLGEQGVQRGFYTRHFHELEEWRLTGDHLRYRLFGEWTSAPCPAQDQPRLRELLTRLAPERETPFQD